MRIGDWVKWDGKACDVTDTDTVTVFGQQVPRVRLRWYSGTRNGKPRARYVWMPVAACTPVATPAPSVEATAVGRKGAFSQRQDVTEAAARVVAKAQPADAKPADVDGLPVGWEREAGGDRVRHVSGMYAEWRPWVGYWVTSFTHFLATRAEAIAACEAWVAANAKPAETACAGCAEKDKRIGSLQERGDRMVRAVARRDEENTALRREVASLSADLARQTDEGNRAHDVLQAAGVPVAPSLSERIGVLLKERDAAVKDEAEATQQDHDLAAELTDTEAKIKHWREVAKYNADGYCTEAKRADGWRWSAWVCGGLAVAGWVTALWLVLPA